MGRASYRQSPRQSGMRPPSSFSEAVVVVRVPRNRRSAAQVKPEPHHRLADRAMSLRACNLMKRTCVQSIQPFTIRSLSRHSARSTDPLHSSEEGIDALPRGSESMTMRDEANVRVKYVHFHQPQHGLAAITTRWASGRPRATCSRGPGGAGSPCRG
jgi:hypothetical protein